MSSPRRHAPRRALVLGTGGSLGYAWAVAALSTWQQATGLDAAGRRRHRRDLRRVDRRVRAGQRRRRSTTSSSTS